MVKGSYVCLFVINFQALFQGYSMASSRLFSRVLSQKFSKHFFEDTSFFDTDKEVKVLDPKRMNFALLPLLYTLVQQLYMHKNEQ